MAAALSSSPMLAVFWPGCRLLSTYLLTYENSCPYNESNGAAPNVSIRYPLILSGHQKEMLEMENEVKPTWKLAWGLWWRMFLIGLGFSVVIGVVMYLVGAALMFRFFPW